MAVPASMRASEAEPLTSARSVTSSAVSASPCGEGSAAAVWAPEPNAPNTSAAGSSPAGSGADSAATSSL